MTESPRNNNLPMGLSVLRQLAAQVNDKTINLGLGKPIDDVHSEIRKLLPKISEAKLDYSENAGLRLVREQLLSALGASSMSPDQVILTHGAQQATSSVMTALLNPLDEVLVPDPGFLSYAPMLRILGVIPVSYSLKYDAVEKVYVHDIDSLLSKITSKTRMILLCSPDNPTGCDITTDQLEKLSTAVQDMPIIILSDEVYGMLHHTKTYRPFALDYSNVISIGSLSKSHAMTGFRLGWILSQSKEVMQSGLVAHQYNVTCASVPAQVLLQLLIQEGVFNGIADEYRILYLKKTELFLSHASEEFLAVCPKVCGSFYLFPRLPKKFLNGDVNVGTDAVDPAMDFCKKVFADKNILITPGSAFGSTKNATSSYRISLAIPDDQVIKAARALSEYY